MFSLRSKWVVVALAVLVPLLFAAYTGHIWEDYFITLRSSRNLVEGHGLVFTPGERLHTFTSPLGVLLPALCTAVAGVENEQLAMWLFRVISVSFLAASVVMVWRRFDAMGVGALGRFTFFGLLLADAKLADFAINGMETAILIFFLLLLWTELEAPDAPRVSRIALACAGLMWTRPDGFIPGAALILPHLVFRRRADGSARVPWRGLLQGIGVGAVIYVPWLLWAWWYYGTPVPHTITAKSGIMPPPQLREFLLTPWNTLLGESKLIDLFLPTYWFYGGWPPFMKCFGYALTVPAAFAWIVPIFPANVRRLSLGVFIGMFYVCAIILFPWYAPPWAIVAALTVALMVDFAAARAKAANRASLASALRITCAMGVAGQIALLAATAWQMRTQERIIEQGVRRPIGEWLRANAAPSDTVLLEPLGYIGYYSRLKTYDFPGLSSREVVAAVRSGVMRYADLIVRLQPTWLVLRPTEIAEKDFAERAVLRDYRLVKTWDALPELNEVGYLPGRKWVEWDARFKVFHYEGPKAPAPK